MSTGIVPNIPQVEQNHLEFNFDVHLSRQHREKLSKIEFQVILSTGKCLVRRATDWSIGRSRDSTRALKPLLNSAKALSEKQRTTPSNKLQWIFSTIF